MDPPPESDNDDEQTILSTVGEVAPVLMLGGILLRKWPAFSVPPSWLDLHPPIYPLLFEVLNRLDVG